MLITSSSTPNFAKAELGGKGWNLFLLERAGLPVPGWVGIPKRVFVEFLTENGLRPRIAAELRSGRSWREVSEAVAEWILAAPLSSGTLALLAEAWARLDRKPVAVRSSAADEDSARHSFAGQLSTSLWVESLAAVERAVRECWASAFSERSLAYRAQNGLLDVERIQVAVVFQLMVEVDKAGVLFGCDPANDAHIVVNAVHGLGEGLVSGLVDGDVYRLARVDGRLVSSHRGENATQVVRTGDGQTGEVSSLRNGSPVLDEAELARLYELHRRVEGLYGWPQDVEWGFAGGRLYVLQARPITTLARNPRGAPQVWDNGNIVESYGGITLPLTFSFAFHAYSHVYVQLCEVMRVPRRVREVLEPNLRSMLGLHAGRVYYNILNWYRLLMVLPRSRASEEFFETIMAVGEGLDVELADELAPPPELRTFAARFGSLVAALSLLWKSLTARRLVENFLKYFHENYARYRDMDFSLMPPERAVKEFHRLELRFLKRWHAPIINDALTMFHFGFFKKLCETWCHDANLANELMSGLGNMLSAAPTRELIRIARLVEQDAALRELVLTLPAEDLHEALAQSDCTTVRVEIQKYIDEYGHRAMNELKLEQIDLTQDPTFLYKMLKNYLRNPPPDPALREREDAVRRAAAEERVALRGWKKMIFGWAMRRAREAVLNRERLRIERTRIFGVARRLFTGVGEGFARMDILDHPRDVFYLTVDEVLGTVRGNLVSSNLRGLVAQRKEDYARYETMEIPPRFVTRGPVYWFNPLQARVESADGSAGELQGVGSCPGVVEGVVKVVLSPDDDLALQGEILVTLRTDPGWVPLFPAVKGLLVERGGLLSHSAIVAREMGLPTIVSVPLLTRRLKSGMRVRMDGARGTIEILEEAAHG